MNHGRSHYEVVTAIGNFGLLLFLDEAPKTSAYFRAHADRQLFDGTTVFRVVDPSKQQQLSDCPISVVQWGYTPESPSPLPPENLESTVETRLTHEKWTLSTARFAANESYGSFFVCMRDEPGLDHGGKRQPDGLGFAPMGKVVSGFDVVEALYGRAGESEMLENPVQIISVRESNGG